MTTKHLTNTVRYLNQDLNSKAQEFKKSKEFFDNFLKENRTFVCIEQEITSIEKFDSVFNICICKTTLGEYWFKFTPYYQVFFQLQEITFRDFDLDLFNKKFTETLNIFLEKVHTKILASILTLNPLDLSFHEDYENSEFSFEEIEERHNQIKFQLYKNNKSNLENFIEENKDYKVIFI